LTPVDSSRDNEPEMTNRLAQETSPYLLQHAGNPVDWHPWGEEALEKAKREDRPLLISIGYSACHWCHVMAHESFEDPGIAALMNDNFVNIKIDREERPDLDEIYMQAVTAQTGRGGWPLTIFALPDGRPFFGGTYFPPEDRHGLPGFARVLQAAADAYKNKRPDIEQSAGTLAELLARSQAADAEENRPGEETLNSAFAGLRGYFDSRYGGFGWAPKFPQASVLEFLMRYALHTGERRALEMATLTLDSMSRGGIYDQLGGGFHRYSTDEKWLVPHFEKMLYDNAALSRAYLHAFLLTGVARYREVAEETLDYVLREMTSPEGGFYSSQDADSEGEEGKYYVWTPGQVALAAGKDAPEAIDYFGVTPAGHPEGSNVLHISGKAPESEAVKRARAGMLAQRRRRVPPATDTKVITGWNGLMLAALAEAACSLDRNDYLKAAEANAEFLTDRLTVGGRLRHSYAGGKAKTGAFLQDYAFLTEGLLLLHQATFRGKWLRKAVELTKTVREEFWDEQQGKLFDAGRDCRELFLRPGSTADTPMPSGASQTALEFLKLGRITADEELSRIGGRLVDRFAGAAGDNPMAMANWLNAADFYLSQPAEFAILGEISSVKTKSLLREICGRWLPNKVAAALDPDDAEPAEGIALLENKAMIDGRPTVYLCRGFTCQEPVTKPEDLKRLMAKLC
jgi:uncharacterized protein